MSLLKSPNKRHGFSLVEMLVVVAIIAVLMALGAAGTFQWINTTKEANSISAVQTIHDILRSHWDKVIQDANKEPVIPSQIMSLASNNPRRARIILIKMRLVEAFPITDEEIRNCPVYVDNSKYIPISNRRYNALYQKELGTATPGSSVESATCLYLILQTNKGNANIDLDAFAKDTNNDGVKEIVDGWGNPVTFCRFPTESNALQNKYSGKTDPLAPDGLLLGSWSGSGTFSSICHTPVNQYLAPVIVSNGRDKQLGLNRTTLAVTNSSQASDNLYSFVLKMGGGAE